MTTIISEGTLRTTDLIETFSAALRSDGTDGADALAQIERDTLDAVLGFEDRGPDDLCLVSILQDEHLDALVAALEELAPEGFYFGSHEGDGALFGFWANEKEEI